MGKERNRGKRGFIVGEATNKDVEEEDVGVSDGEKEATRVAHGAEIRELVGEFGDQCEIILEAMNGDLSVGLGKVGESRGSAE